MKIQGVLPLGLSLLVSGVAVWVLSADFAAHGVSYDLGKGLSFASVMGVMATFTGGIWFGALRVASGGREKAMIIVLAFFAFWLLVFFNAVFMAFGLSMSGTILLQETFFRYPFGASLAQVIFSAWFSKYL